MFKWSLCWWELDVKDNIWVLDSLVGWVWQAPAFVLHHPDIFLLCFSVRSLLPERQWEMGARDSVPLSQSPHHPRGDTVGPQRRRQSPHRAGQMQREAGTWGGGQVVCRGDQSHLLHWVLSFWLRRTSRRSSDSHCSRHSVLDSQQQPKNFQEQTPNKMKTLSKSWWKKYCCFVWCWWGPQRAVFR